MALTIVTAPTVKPVTDAEIRLHLHIDSAEGSALVNTYIDTATRYCERLQNRAYLDQIWNLVIDGWPAGDIIQIPLPPLQAISSVIYYGTGNTANTMTTTVYHVDTDNEPGSISLAYGEVWPGDTLRPVNGIVIKFTCGYGSVATAVPEMPKQAIKLLVGHWFEHRENTDIKKLEDIPDGVFNLLSFERIWPI